MATTAVAQGFFTITDLNDAISLSGYLTCSQSKAQRYLSDDTRYLPDWRNENTHPVLTPVLYKSGGTSDLFESPAERKKITSITWYANDKEIEKDGNVYQFLTGNLSDFNGGGSSLNYKLQISDNVMSPETDSGLNIRCVIKYKDSSSALETTHNMEFPFTILKDGGGLVQLEITTPDGYIFKNNEITSLRVQLNLVRGTQIDSDKVKYYWAYPDEDSESDIFGDGWHEINPTPTTDLNYAKNGNVLTVKPDAVSRILPLRCAAEDTDVPQGTETKKYIDGITLIDSSDPLQVEIVSSNGNTFKNGSGTAITLTAKVYQGGVCINEADIKSPNNPTICSYDWTHYGKQGIQVNGSSINSATSCSITVQPSNVDGKSTFLCKVTYPKSTS